MERFAQDPYYHFSRAAVRNCVCVSFQAPPNGVYGYGPSAMDYVATQLYACVSKRYFYFLYSSWCPDDGILRAPITRMDNLSPLCSATHPQGHLFGRLRALILAHRVFLGGFLLP